MAEEEGAQLGRPQRKKTGARVIYRECDSDDEDYETFALIRYVLFCYGGSDTDLPVTNHNYWFIIL